ncbi:hypothetical protein [Paraglaciecola chathamensis]|uniref:Uncharacterized protein n=1 Tax=Paraglaciecola chathamensis TaxID=368405 RepID=A0A8H9M3A3_9ALTE|nr:hypothetical protein [Paraglaciecola oceanifecundans]GGZ83219.1 hypothetical protein GCM10011274_46060 [Paraglaciecola oceanifecundans]
MTFKYENDRAGFKTHDYMDKRARGEKIEVNKSDGLSEWQLGIFTAPVLIFAVGTQVFNWLSGFIPAVYELLMQLSTTVGGRAFIFGLLVAVAVTLLVLKSVSLLYYGLLETCLSVVVVWSQIKEFSNNYDNFAILFAGCFVLMKGLENTTNGFKITAKKRLKAKIKEKNPPRKAEGRYLN